MAALGPAAAPAAAAAGARGQLGAEGEDDDGEEQRPGKRGKKKAEPKEYIPALRSAPYCFLICMLQVGAAAGCAGGGIVHLLAVGFLPEKLCPPAILPPLQLVPAWLPAASPLPPRCLPAAGLLSPLMPLSLLPLSLSQAQKGPARQAHFGKAELLDLAEASGLSDKPIRGDGGPAVLRCAALCCAALCCAVLGGAVGAFQGYALCCAALSGLALEARVDRQGWLKGWLQACPAAVCQSPPAPALTAADLLFASPVCPACSQLCQGAAKRPEVWV